MNFLTSLLLTNLIAFACSDAYYPPNFFLKGPTSQATIYGVDGSKIISVADAGSISSAGIKGPTFSSHTSTQNLEGSASKKIVSPGCNCSESEQGVVLKGPSMSATIIGPSVSTYTENTADIGGNQNKNIPNSQGHYSSNIIGPSFEASIDNSALPSVPSVNIQGPSAWGTNIANQQPSGATTKPCGSSSKDCGGHSFRTKYPSGTDINIQGPSTWSSGVSTTYSNGQHGNTGNQDASGITSSSGFSNGNAVNFHSSSSTPSHIYIPSKDTSNLSDQKSSTTFSKPCDQLSKNCNGVTGVNIQGPSASSSITGPYHSGSHIASEYLQPNAYKPSVSELCNSSSKNCEHHGSTGFSTGSAAGTITTETPSYYSSYSGKSTVSHYSSGNNAGLLNSTPGSDTKGPSTHYTIENSAYPHSDLGGSKINSEPSGDSNSPKDIGAKDRTNENNNGYHTTSFTGGSGFYSGSLVKSDDNHGAQGHYNTGYTTGINSNIHTTSPTFYNSGSSSYSGAFNKLNSNQHLPINAGTSSSLSNTPDIYGQVAGSSKNGKSSFNIHKSYGLPGGQNKAPGSYNNLHNINTNSNQGFASIPTAPGANGQGSFGTSINNGPNDKIGYTRGQNGYFTSASYISPVYNKPSQASTTNWSVTKSFSSGGKTITPNSNIGYNSQNNVHSLFKGHHIESSSMAPPTYALPNDLPQLGNDLTQNQGFFRLNQASLFGFGRDGKKLKDSKYDCYVIQLPSDSFAYVLSPGEYSELLNKIAQSTKLGSNTNDYQHNHFHNNQK